ncbi:MAG: DUF962 domain-containing protein [Gammaproteobacteria bacterium]|nr:MAG: DUF962 domain-containing protein [Gammaproteobacteria bacterium]
MPQSAAPKQLEIHDEQHAVPLARPARLRGGCGPRSGVAAVTSAPVRLRPPTFASFREFYPYYLGQHSHPISRRLHVCGTLLALAVALAALVTGRWAWLLGAPLAGYLPAWVGHYFFERNVPATFSHPLYSLRGDLSLLVEVLTGRMPW